MTGCTSPSRLTKPPGWRVNGMRQHVAWPQQRNHAGQNRVDILAIGAALRQAPELTEMHVDRQVGASSDLGGHFDDANAPAREAADLGMRLDAANQIAIGHGRLDGGVDVDAVGAVEIGVVVSLQVRRPDRPTETHRRATGLLGDEMPETRQRHAGRAALIDQRRHAGLHADHVRVHAEAAGNILIDMGVGVDQSGQHDLAADVDNLPRARRHDVGLHGRDLAAADGDVLEAIDARGRIDDAATAQQQIECGGQRHGRSPPGCADRKCGLSIAKHTSYCYSEIQQLSCHRLHQIRAKRRSRRAVRGAI